jgi:hypothetical protein
MRACGAAAQPPLEAWLPCDLEPTRSPSPEPAWVAVDAETLSAWREQAWDRPGRRDTPSADGGESAASARLARLSVRCASAAASDASMDLSGSDGSRRARARRGRWGRTEKARGDSAAGDKAQRARRLYRTRAPALTRVRAHASTLRPQQPHERR